MLIDIEQLRVLFQELIRILEKENDNETLYIINQLELGLLLIDECLNSIYENKDLKQLFSKLEEIYKKSISHELVCQIILSGEITMRNV